MGLYSKFKYVMIRLYNRLYSKNLTQRCKLTVEQSCSFVIQNPLLYFCLIVNYTDMFLPCFRLVIKSAYICDASNCTQMGVWGFLS